MARRGTLPRASHKACQRVRQACDRCRLKKSRCDGGQPCVRCRANNAICVFGKRKKSDNKVYPKWYIEMLEQQQASLVACLQELYHRIRDGSSWSGPPLKCDANGHPCIHDLITRLGTLDHSSSEGERFEISQVLVHFGQREGQNAPAPMQDACDSSSEYTDSSIVPARSVDYVAQQMLSTPASFSTSAPVELELSLAPSSESQLTMTGYVNPTVLQVPPQHQWVADEVGRSDGIEMTGPVCFGNVFADEDAMWSPVFQQQPYDCSSYYRYPKSHYNNLSLYVNVNTPDILSA
ncbi:hypothetical protein BDW75DRAFT_225110 [Aspergillus navahoensis]